MQIRMRFEQSVQKSQVLWKAAHVRGDPRHGEAIKRASQRRVVIELDAVLRMIGVLRGEPRVGIGDVRHADHPQSLRKFELLGAHRSIEREQRRVASFNTKVD